MQIEWNGHQVIDEIHARLLGALNQMASQVVSIAESLAPKRTGRLATSITADVNPADLSVTFHVGAPYGVFQEFGTRNIPPHPYLRPALNHVFSQVFGFNTAMSFDAPHINSPLLANAGGFDVPNGVLSARQKRHVNERLLPTSKRYHVGAVGRSKLHVRRHY